MRALAVFLAGLTFASAAAAQPIAIRAGTLIDGRGGPPIRNAVVVVDSQRIVAAGTGIAIPAGTRVIDLSGHTLMPGWIDAHTHITAPVVGADGWEADVALVANSLRALRAAHFAREALETGFTTIREV